VPQWPGGHVGCFSLAVLAGSPVPMAPFWFSLPASAARCAKPSPRASRAVIQKALATGLTEEGRLPRIKEGVGQFFSHFQVKSLHLLFVWLPT